MNPLIEFCINNLASGSYPAFEKLKKDPDLDVIELGCTSHCAICAMTIFAIVEGKCITADSNEELVEKVYKYLEETE
mgnify:CR=1 FL=1